MNKILLCLSSSSGAELVAGVSENSVSLSNGCVCCSIRDDLVESILQFV